MSKRPHSYNSGRIYRAGNNQPQAERSQNPDDEYLPPPVKMKKKRRWPVVVTSVFLVIILALGGAIWYVWNIADDAVDPGEFGQIANSIVDVSGNEVVLPEAYNKSDVVHFLILGIDYEDGRQYVDSLGMTDMILYARYDLKNNQLNLLQVPRDSYVGEGYAGDGKINSLLINGADRENPINNIVVPFQAMFKLPVDYYLTIDMQSLKHIVDVFGGLRVYVPQDMAHDGVSLEQGWQWLNGDYAEFFVRTRYGAGFERADIDRLDNQRYFYSALFRRFLNMTAGDVVNLLPVIKEYCNTNLEVGDLVSIGIAALNLKAENVLFCKAPGATGAGLDPRGADANGNERSLYVIDLYGRGDIYDEEGNLGENPGLAALLNEYFRSEGVEVSAGELLLPQQRIGSSYALYPPNIQGLGTVQEEEGGADIDVEPTWDESGNFIG